MHKYAFAEKHMCAYVSSTKNAELIAWIFVCKLKAEPVY